MARQKKPKPKTKPRSKVPVKIGKEQKLGRESTQFKPGQSGNPNGRPPGSFSIKDSIRKTLEKNPKLVEQLVAHFITKYPDLMWQMLEGRPKQQQDIDVPNDSIKELTDFFRAAAAPKPEKKPKKK